MIFDTDIFIWVQRKNERAADLIDKSPQRYLSIQSYMELLQGANKKSQHQYIKDFLNQYNFIVLPFTENIGHRASIYMGEYISSNLSGKFRAFRTPIPGDSGQGPLPTFHFPLI